MDNNQGSSDKQANKGMSATPDNYFPKGDQGGGLRIQINQADIPPRTIKQRHMEAWIVFSGLDAKRPLTHTTEVKAWFSTDTNKLWIDNGTTWVGTVLS